MPGAGLITCVDPLNCEVPRREPLAPPMLTPAQRNVRPIEKVYPHDAPTPPAQGDTPARAARYPIITFQAVAPIQSVMNDIFQGSLQGAINHAAVNFWRGGRSDMVRPWGERFNVERTPSLPYGSGFAMTEDEGQLLLMGAR